MMLSLIHIWEAVSSQLPGLFLFQIQFSMQARMALSVTSYSRFALSMSAAAAAMLPDVYKRQVHCYSGSADDAVWLARQGLYFGFGGACTFKGAKRAAKALSLIHI